jgi:hypothetical protein
VHSYFTSKYGDTADPSPVEGYALKKAFFHSERVLQDILKKIIILYSIITKIVHPFLDDIEI